MTVKALLTLAAILISANAFGEETVVDRKQDWKTVFPRGTN